MPLGARLNVLGRIRDGVFGTRPFSTRPWALPKHFDLPRVDPLVGFKQNFLMPPYKSVADFRFPPMPDLDVGLRLENLISEIATDGAASLLEGAADYATSLCLELLFLAWVLLDVGLFLVGVEDIDGLFKAANWVFRETTDRPNDVWQWFLSWYEGAFFG
jgi:hypothetical protein